MMNEILKIIENNESLISLFKSCPLFILERLEKIKYTPGQFELFQEKSYNYTYIIVSGQVKVYLTSASGKSVVLDIYGSGMLVGEQEAILNKPYSASIINITEVVLLRLHNNDFKQWLACDNLFANKMIYNLSSQIYHLTQRTERYSLYSAMEQIINFLLVSAEKSSFVTREQIAYEVDTSYRNISRILKKLVDFKVISIQDGRINIDDKIMLKQLFFKGIDKL